MNVNFLLYAPADPDGTRTGRAARAVEELLPETTLDLTLSSAQALIPVEDREALLRERARLREVPTLTDKDLDRSVVFGGAYLAPVVAPGGKPLLQLNLLTSRVDSSELAGRLLGALGEAIEAYWGHVTPRSAAATIADQIIHDPDYHRPPEGLPPLRPWTPQSDPAVPLLLGWWNYGSRATVERLGAPPDAVPLPSGAVVWRVTDEPLDLQRRDHVAALAAAYARFPRIGQ